MQRINLYKFIKDRLVLIDYGIKSQIDSYVKQGYIVIIEFGIFKYNKEGTNYETNM